MVKTTHAPGVPEDYYRRIHQAEQRHWWHRGMLAITEALLGARLTAGSRLLDAGCGTGGFLRWALDRAQLERVCGVDIGSAAIELARERVPEAELAVTPLTTLPFEDGTFDLVSLNDVLQHVPEDDVELSLGELRRVTTADGTLLVRTGGSRELRQERDDWRAYSSDALRSTLEEAGWSCRRVTYANTLLSAVATVRGRTPHAPDEGRHGIPSMPSSFQSAVGRALLGAEARYLRAPGRTLPYGHTLFAVAVRR